MRPRSLASGSTTTRRALTTATPPAPKSHALAAVGAAAGALGSVAVGGLRRDSTHDSAGRRAPRGQRDLSRRRHVHGRCRRRCLLRGPRRRRREGALHHGRSRSGRRRRPRLRGVGAVARRRPRRGLGPVGRRHASEVRSKSSPSTRSTCGPRQAGTRRTPSPRTVPAPGAPSDVPGIFASAARLAAQTFSLPGARPRSSRQTELRQIAHRRQGEEDAYWRSEFAAREGNRRHDVEEAYWRQFLEDVSGMSREEQDADLEAAPGGYGLSSIASLWRAESQSLEEDAV